MLNTGPDTPIRVFVSYSHDSDRHRARVLDLAQRLRKDGIDCIIDAFVNGHPQEGWPLWMERQVEEADFVLVVCSTIYHRRFQGEERPDRGRGVAWESTLIREQLYSTQEKNRKYIPILFEEATTQDIPGLLRHRFSHYTLMEQYEELLRYLTNQPRVVPEPLGRRKKLVALSQHVHNTKESREFAASIRDYMNAFSQRVETLTDEQYQVITRLRGVGRIRILGCAGSGKTLVAAEKAIRLSKAGIQTLFLCHNPLLAKHVAGLTQGSGVHVESFEKWIAALTTEEHWRIEGPWTNFEEPSTDSIGQAFDIILERGPRYGAIIVDEGQDFRDEWWAVVEASLADPDNGILYVFHDDRQALLPYRACYPIEKPVYDLSRNCRNAGKIYEVMRHLRPETPAPDDELKELGDVLLLTYDRFSRRGETDLVKQAIHWIAQAGFAKSFIVLLGGATAYENSPFATGDFYISEAPSWQETVRKKFNMMRVYDTRGVMFPPAGLGEVMARLDDLSTEPFPTAEDIKLVQEVARSFRVHNEVKRKIIDHPHHGNMAWKLRGDKLLLLRPTKAKIWSAEVILHFKREDWHIGLPEPRPLRFQEHSKADSASAVPVYYTGNYKGLEADAILLFIRGPAPILAHEVYVGISRARLLLAAVIDNETAEFFPGP